MRRRREEYDRVIGNLKNKGFINLFYLDHKGREILNSGQRFYPKDVFICEEHVFDEGNDSGEIFYTYAIKTKSGLRGILEGSTASLNFDLMRNLVQKFHRL